MLATFFVLGAIFGGSGVALGAFGAHALASRVSSERLNTFETGVRYQLVHALALLATAFAGSSFPTSPWPLYAGWLFVAGIVLFSVSLYLLVLSGKRWLGAITPLGGLAMIAGWLCLLLSAL
ncbi:MAG: DUF423 domain-containing protein [Anaerolineales bacterium]|jgi:uncharacterized membrane protein YgdD (TMEM256/DUF423 family)